LRGSDQVTTSSVSIANASPVTPPAPLPTLAVVGIVLGVLVFVALVILLIVAAYFYSKRKQGGGSKAKVSGKPKEYELL